MPKKQDTYIFPAVIEKNANNYSVFLPDLPGCVASGNNIHEAILYAKEALAFHLWGMEQDNELIPSPSSPENIQLEKNDTLCYLDVNMLSIRSKMDNRSVKKTLTIPAWLNERALAEKVNFSNVLQNALLKELKIV